MALRLWRDLDDFYFDPWRVHRDIMPSIRAPRPWFEDFGCSIHPSDIKEILAIPREFRQMENRLRENTRRMAEGVTTIAPTVGKDGFNVCVDVQQFAPNEISVKTDDRYVTIEGKHEERQDEHGYISRQFVRRYALPSGYDPNTITSELSSDGILSVKAPPPNAIDGAARTVSIQQTGPARLNVKDNQPVEDKKEQK